MSAWHVAKAFGRDRIDAGSMAQRDLAIDVDPGVLPSALRFA